MQTVEQALGNAQDGSQPLYTVDTEAAEKLDELDDSLDTLAGTVADGVLSVADATAQTALNAMSAILSGAAAANRISIYDTDPGTSVPCPAHAVIYSATSSMGYTSWVQLDSMYPTTGIDPGVAITVMGRAAGSGSNSITLTLELSGDDDPATAVVWDTVTLELTDVSTGTFAVLTPALTDAQRAMSLVRWKVDVVGTITAGKFAIAGRGARLARSI